MRRLLLALALLAPGLAAAECAPDRLDVRGPFGSVRFEVEVADDPQERSQGLMFVEEMAPFEGMLFVYERPQPVSFWMRNTLIPLDMIFAGADGVVTRVHEGAVPLDETPIPGGNEVQYVLEVNAGMASRLGIAPGAELRHPAIEEAAWPCAVAEDGPAE